MNILVTGANGQLGNEMRIVSRERAHHYIFTDVAELDITDAAGDLYELVTLRQLSTALMARIHRNYRFIVGFNLMLILLGVGGIIQPTTSALLHNMSTLGISLKSMTDLLPEKAEEE